MASQFNGQEIGSIQALHTAEIELIEDKQEGTTGIIDEELIEEILQVNRKVHSILIEQHEGWKKRPLFERMWVFRDFTKHAGMSVDKWLEVLTKVEQICERGESQALSQVRAPFNKLVIYIKHMQDLAKGFVKDKKKLEESLGYLRSWQKEAEKLENLINK